MAWYLYRLRAHRSDFAQTMSEAEMSAMQAHVEYWRGPLNEGRVLIYSPVADPERSWGLAIVQAESEAELAKLRSHDPAYLAGVGDIDWLLLPMPVVSEQVNLTQQFPSLPLSGNEPAARVTESSRRRADGPC